MKIPLSFLLVTVAACNASDLPTTVALPASTAVSLIVKTVDTLALDYPYTAANRPHQRMDVFRPRGAAGAIPAVLCIHGGAWQSGDKALTPSEPCWRHLAHGMALVALNYRLSGDSVWPAQMHDIFTAIRCLRSKAPVFGIDPARIGVMGTSAGAHLALLTGVTSDTSLLGLSLGCPGQPSGVKAVASFFGPTDFYSLHAQVALNGCVPDPTMDNAVLQLLGLTSLTTHQDSMKVASISPVNSIRRVLPVVMWNGDLDCVVPYQQMTNFQNAMALQGGTVKLHIAYGYAHGIKNSAIADSASGFMYYQLTH